MKLLPTTFRLRTNFHETGMKRESLLIVGLFVSLFLLFPLFSCQEESGTNPQGRPAAERTSVHYMLPAVRSAHEAVIEANKMLQGDSQNIEAARSSLDKAAQNLTNLEWFYIPATEARDNVYNAYLEHLAGHADQRDAYLESAKRGLVQIAERSSTHVEPYIVDLTDRIETVQRLIRDGIPVDDELKSLCEFFQLHLLKAQLVVDEHTFAEQ